MRKREKLKPRINSYISAPTDRQHFSIRLLNSIEHGLKL